MKENKKKIAICMRDFFEDWGGGLWGWGGGCNTAMIKLS